MVTDNFVHYNRAYLKAALLSSVVPEYIDGFCLKYLIVSYRLKSYFLVFVSNFSSFLFYFIFSKQHETLMCVSFIKKGFSRVPQKHTLN